MDAIRNLVPLLPLVLPLVGKLLSIIIPFVPNKLIPFVNAIVATAAKYWFLAGWGTLGAVPATEDTGMNSQTILMAGVLGEIGRGGLSILWGCLDSAAAHFFYESKRAQAKLVNEVSWWEKGKRSIY